MTGTWKVKEYFHWFWFVFYSAKKLKLIKTKLGGMKLQNKLQICVRVNKVGYKILNN